MTGEIYNQVVKIGARKSMIGLITQPTNYEPSARPVFVILNSGIIHRVGHHRMYVSLARILAKAGFQVLRFDLSGIGDSESRLDELSPLDGVIADIREVVNWLETARRAQRFVLLGLCLGADHALLYGISDPRVCGLVLLDPSIPPTLGYHCRDIIRQLMRPQSWIKFARGRGRRWRKVREFLGVAGDDAFESSWHDLGSPEIRAFLKNAYERSVDLGMQCLMVLTSGIPHQHNYRRQIFDAFPDVPFDGQLRLEYFSHCDHLFTSEGDRARLFGMVEDWVRNTSFGAPSETEAYLEHAVVPNPHDLVTYEI